MRRHLKIVPLVAIGILFCGSIRADNQKPMTVDEIKQAVIQESIASYPGHCPCPYNLASNGSKCGKRSAWSKPGGYAPICYPDEVTPEMEKQWSLKHGYLWNELRPAQ